jgi:hypothetical protein
MIGIAALSKGLQKPLATHYGFWHFAASFKANFKASKVTCQEDRTGGGGYETMIPPVQLVPKWSFCPEYGERGVGPVMAQILTFPRAKIRPVPSGPRTTDDRPRDFLTEAEMVLLLKAAHQGRYGSRDAARCVH